VAADSSAAASAAAPDVSAVFAVFAAAFDLVFAVAAYPVAAAVPLSDDSKAAIAPDAIDALLEVFADFVPFALVSAVALLYTVASLVSAALLVAPAADFVDVVAAVAAPD